MPLYQFRDVDTLNIEEHMMPYSEIDMFLMRRPELERVYTSPSIASEVGSRLNKTDDSWNDLLKEVKKGSDSQNTIKTK